MILKTTPFFRFEQIQLCFSNISCVTVSIADTNEFDSLTSESSKNDSEEHYIPPFHTAKKDPDLIELSS